MPWDDKKIDKPYIKQLWHQAYIEMMSSPDDTRSDEEFCAEAKIGIAGLGHWKKEFGTEIFEEISRRRQKAISQVRTLAWRALMKKIGSDTKALDLLFQLIGDKVDRSETKIELMNREEKEKRFLAILEAAQKQKNIQEQAKKDGK